jgi:FkbM family methyltransferase
MIENFIRYIEHRHKDYVIFDVGSRDCAQAIEFYHQFPNAKIYAFECNPNTLEICKKNIQMYKDRITLIEGAVCDYDGTIKFYPINQEKTITTWQDGNPGASSVFKSNGKYTVETYVQDEITTNCHRLDSVMKKHGIPKVDIIWMDLQGAEFLALKGLGSYIDTVKYMHTEISHKEMYSGQVMFKELNDYIISKNFVIKNNLSLTGWQEDVIYEKQQSKQELFDLVIPVGPCDKDVIESQLEYTKQNIIGYRNIYLICYDPTINFEGCLTIDEALFPFSLDTVSKIHGKSGRNGWYLQQLIKFYVGKVIPGIMERYLVVDSDTFFLKPTTFIENNKCLYNYGTEHHLPYFEHMANLDKEFVRVDAEKSGICHHMIFETKYVNELMTRIEGKYGEPFYIVFLKQVPALYKQCGSGASEYEIYFNYMLKNHSDKITIRALKWENVGTLDVSSELDYISYHYWKR